MARHEPRNSKVAELRPCNEGFHNVGFDSSTYLLPHNALLRRLLARAPPCSSFLSNFPLFFSLPNRTPREKDAARPLRRLFNGFPRRSGEMRIMLGSWKHEQARE